MRPYGKNPSSFYPLSALLITLLLLAFQLQPCYAEKPSTDFIRSSCGATTYPKLCIHTLSSYASEIQTNPKHLAHAALNVSLSGARSTSAIISRLSASRDLKARTKGAMKDCIELIADSVDQIRQSMEEMHQLTGPDFDMHISNMQTWVSAALTDDDTCMDGFSGAGANANLKKIVRRHIRSVSRMTSNALALINNLQSAKTKSP